MKGETIVAIGIVIFMVVWTPFCIQDEIRIHKRKKWFKSLSPEEQQVILIEEQEREEWARRVHGDY